MWPWLKGFFTDEDSFLAALPKGIAYLRMILGSIGIALHSGIIPLPESFEKTGWYLGWVLLIAVMGISAGDKTPPLAEQFKAAPPAELAEVKDKLRQP